MRELFAGKIVAETANFLDNNQRIKLKEILTDENLEKLRDTCSNVRDLAILELLISTGIRVGGLTRLNISDINFQERSCIVLGKGNSEREVYFSAKSKMYIEKYLETRNDKNEALVVSLIKPYNRLGISGIEIAISISIHIWKKDSIEMNIIK